MLNFDLTFLASSIFLLMLLIKTLNKSLCFVYKLYIVIFSLDFHFFYVIFFPFLIIAEDQFNLILYV